MSVSSSLSKIGVGNFYLYFLVLAFLISSDDILFVFYIPFALRLSIVLLALFMMFGLGRMAQTGRIIMPYGYPYLLGWLAFSVLGIAFSPVPFFSLFETLFFAFDVLLVLVLPNVVNPKNFGAVFNLYLSSFVFMAMFGLLQFGVGLFGVKLLALQTWSSHLVRINGLSYEPSYYAIYMSAGYLTLGYLKEKNFKGINHLSRSYYIVLAAMILSSSRTGIALVAMWYLRIGLYSFQDLLRGTLKKSRVGMIAVIGMVLVGGVAFVASEGPERFLFLLQGTGVGGTAAQSITDRTNLFYQTLAVFLKNPFFGVGIGGLNYYQSILTFGVATQDASVLRLESGSNVTAEILTSVGSVGSIFVFLFFAAFLFKMFRLKGRVPIVSALAIGLFGELFLLQFAQDIERVYVWVHVAMLCAAIRVYTSKSADPNEVPGQN